MLLLQIYIQNISKTQLNFEMKWQNNIWPSNINKFRVKNRYYITLMYFLSIAEILEVFLTSGQTPAAIGPIYTAIQWHTAAMN